MKSLSPGEDENGAADRPYPPQCCRVRLDVAGLSSEARRRRLGQQLFRCEVLGVDGLLGSEPRRVTGAVVRVWGPFHGYACRSGNTSARQRHAGGTPSAIPRSPFAEVSSSAACQSAPNSPRGTRMFLRVRLSSRSVTRTPQGAPAIRPFDIAKATGMVGQCCVPISRAARGCRLGPRQGDPSPSFYRSTLSAPTERHQTSRGFAG